MSTGGKKRISAVKAALLSDKEWASSDALRLAAAEPIAIVGTACRLPGGINSPDEFWRALADGADCIEQVPAERWDRDAYFDEDPSAPGKINTLFGGFLHDVDRFDSHLFGIAPREARYIDPQHRLLLELSWEAFEDAGRPLDSIRGSRTGVFFGLSNSDYGRMQLNHTDKISAHTLSGTAPSIASGRLSYLFDLRGPSMVIDTACSSSLSAVHLAIQSLRYRESNIAVAGGISLNLVPQETISLAKWGMLSPDGRCKTFDESANGFVRSEGCGLVVLKRLADALRDGDPVRAVIRGCAINQDGRSNVLTAPNGEAQRAVIRSALDQAGAEGADISFVETHGTGTRVGDPIEVEALADVLGPNRRSGDICYLGAVKANIGHLEAAAGVAGLIKLVLCLQHRAIPPQVHYRQLNPLVSLDDAAIRIPRELTDWVTGDQPRLAGVSSFGFSGTNVHLVVEEAPALPQPVDAAAATRDVPHVLPVSARHAAGVPVLAERYRAMLADGGTELRDVCYTAATRRSHFNYRLAGVGQDASALAADIAERAKRTPATATNDKPRIAFVYSGQGCYWPGMARDLLQREPVFADFLKHCDELFRPLAGWSIVDELGAGPDDTGLTTTVRFQPVLFAIQAGLTALWRSWGVEPGGVIGHSVGEVAAAWAAGMLDLEGALQLVELRGRLMQECAGSGAMAAVGLSPDAIRQRLPDMSGLSIAASNAADAATLSGEAAAIARAVEQLDGDGVFCRRLDVDCAFHSEAMAPCLEPLQTAVAGLRTSPPAVPYYSTVLGARLGDDEDADRVTVDGDYWAQNARQPVLFHEATCAMLDDGYTAFVEIGPHPVLSGYVAAAAERASGPVPVLASMRRGQPDALVVRQALADLYVHGIDPAWRAVLPAGRAVALPRYPFKAESLWLPWVKDSASTTTDDSHGHPLLGRRIADGAGIVYETDIDTTAVGYLADHRIGDVCVFPAAAMIEMMCAAARAEGQASGALYDLAIESPLVLAEGTPRHVRLEVLPGRAGLDLVLRAQSAGHDASGDTIARARWGLLDGDQSEQSTLAAVRRTHFADGVARQDVAAHYEHARQVGITFGPAFRSLTAIECAGDRSLVSVQASGTAEDAYFVHPVSMDGFLQSIDAAMRTRDAATGMLLPIAIGKVHCQRSVAGATHAMATLRATAAPGAAGTVVDADIVAFDDDGAVVATLERVRMKLADASAVQRLQSLARNAVSGGADHDLSVYRIDWQDAPLPAGNAATQPLLICSNDAALLAATIEAREMQSPGAACFALTPPGLQVSPEATAVAHVDPFSRDTIAAALAQFADALPGADGIDVVVAWQSPPRNERQVVADLESATGNAPLAAAFHVLQCLADAALPGNVRAWLVTTGGQAVASDADIEPEQAAIWGLHSAVSIEHPELACRLLDLDPMGDAAGQARALVAELGARSAEDRVAVRDNRRLVARLRADPAKPAATQGVTTAPYRYLAPQTGRFEDIAQQPLVRQAPPPGCVEIAPAVVGLNFRDVLNTLNEVQGPAGDSLGAECAGKVVAVGESVSGLSVGDDVLAFAYGSLASHVCARQELVVRKPAALDVVEAAGIPAVFLTAQYALHHVADMTADKSVLIHAGAGGVGLSAIQVAMAAGATVIATAGSPRKRAYLRSLGVPHVFDSRSTAFREDILRVTAGSGVDIVLNSLAGDLIPASLDVLREGGTFVELGKRDAWDQDKVDARYTNIRHERIDLGETAERDPALAAALFEEVMQAFETGACEPLPTTVFGPGDVPAAMRYMAQARHIGKLVIPLRAEAPARAARIAADATYLVTGGLGALGLQVAEKLVEKGATALLLAGRSAGSGAAMERVRRLAAKGARVDTVNLDVVDSGAVTALVDSINRVGPPLRGVIHCAGFLEDAAFTRQDWQSCRRTMAPKAVGAWNLHRATRGQELDFFVTFSAASAIFGWAGQANYAAANACMDGIAHYRAARGLAALSINWGAWAEGGMANDIASDHGDPFSAQGLLFHDGDAAVERMIELLTGDAVQRTVGRFDWPRFAARFAPASVPPVFADVCGGADSPTADRGSQAETRPAILDQLVGAPAARRPRLVARFVESEAADVLELAEAGLLDRAKPLNEQGLDSLLAVEMRNRIAAALQVRLPASLLFDYPTTTELARHLVEDVLQFDAGASSERDNVAKAAADRPAFENEVLGLTESEAEEQLLRELSGDDDTSGPMDQR